MLREMNERRNEWENELIREIKKSFSRGNEPILRYEWEKGLMKELKSHSKL